MRSIVWQALPEQVRLALSMMRRAGFTCALVGGCVRDALMGRAIGDYDMATDALPEQVMDVFSGARVIPTGLKHGTVTVLLGALAMEITTFRSDGDYADHRHPEAVAFSRSLREDVQRRDFTMNALAWVPGRGLVDTVGGLDDIAAGVIRCVGEPRRRFSEDALRILRAARFAAQTGFAIEPETFAAAEELAGNVSAVSAERVRVELCKLLQGAHAREVLLRAEPILRPRLACADALAGDMWARAAERVQRMQALSANGFAHVAELPGNAEGRLWAAMLLEAAPERAQETLQALKMDRETERNAMRCMQAANAADLGTQYGLRRLCGACGHACVREGILLRYGEDAETRERLLAWLETVLTRQLPCRVEELPVKGGDLLAKGLRGKAIREELSRLLEIELHREIV